MTPPFTHPKTVFECRSNLSWVMRNSLSDDLVDWCVWRIDYAKSCDRYDALMNQLNVEIAEARSKQRNKCN